ncbi:MAG TPA: hypothetical protein DCR87_04780 [Acidobacteria bacterium]|nr:hypothetical protein [Acidobacteriota bacterium]
MPYQIYSRVQGETVIRISTGYEYDLKIAPLGADSFVYGYSKEYLLTVIDSSGQPQLLIKNRQKTRPIPAKNWKRWPNT